MVCIRRSIALHVMGDMQLNEMGVPAPLPADAGAPMPNLPSDPSNFGIGRRITAGTLGFTYIAGLFVVNFFFLTAFVVWVLGVGATLFNVQHAFKTWEWWRLLGPVFSVYLPAFFVYILYQERKTSMVNGMQSPWNRGWTRVAVGVFLVAGVLLGAWMAVLTVWFGVADIADCFNSPECSGAVPSKTPSTGAIMMIVGMSVITLCIWIQVLIVTYVHIAIGQTIALILNSRMLFAANEIGGEMAPLTSPLASGTVRFVNGCIVDAV